MITFVCLIGLIKQNLMVLDLFNHFLINPFLSWILVTYLFLIEDLNQTRTII